MLCGFALSPWRNTRSRPARSTTATDVLAPHSWLAVSAIVNAMRSETSRWVRTWAAGESAKDSTAAPPAATPNRNVIESLRALLLLSAHLHFESVRILDVEAAFSHPNIQLATLQLRFDRCLDRRVRIPVGQRVRDMIDTCFAAGPT